MDHCDSLQSGKRPASLRQRVNIVDMSGSHDDWISNVIGHIDDPQCDLPRMAKDKAAMSRIDAAVSALRTWHRVFNADARDVASMVTEKVHLVVTSPPYWVLKKYNESRNQLGSVVDYEVFLSQLDRVWKACLDLLVPGGRLIVVVGDVCLSRRKNNGEHAVIPLHASIQERCRLIGFSNLSPIIWHKIANAKYEADGNGAGFLGKPYEPNAVIKNDIEFILMERKPGGYRSPSLVTRLLSLISEDHHRQWFNQIWSDIPGASTRAHPAPYPVELAERLIRMFSFVGDTVLDPFWGTGTTSVAAASSGRNSIGIEVDADYYRGAVRRLHDDCGLFAKREIIEG